MTTFGYILIDDKKWYVKVIQRKTRRTVSLRPDSFDGRHMKGVQAFLEQPEHRWLVDRLRYGERVYVPLANSEHPTSPAVSED